jgi:hypothetical protein
MTGQANSRGFNPGPQDATPTLPWPHLEDNMGLAEYSTSTIRASLPPSNMRKNIFNTDVDFDLEDFSTPPSHLVQSPYQYHPSGRAQTRPSHLRQSVYQSAPTRSQLPPIQAQSDTRPRNAPPPPEPEFSLLIPIDEQSNQSLIGDDALKGIQRLQDAQKEHTQAVGEVVSNSIQQLQDAQQEHTRAVSHAVLKSIQKLHDAQQKHIRTIEAREAEIAKLKSASPVDINEAASDRTKITTLEIEVKALTETLIETKQKLYHQLRKCWVHIDDIETQLSLTEGTLALAEAKADVMGDQNALLRRNLELQNRLFELLPDIVQFCEEKRSKKKGAMKLSAVKLAEIKNIMKTHLDEIANVTSPATRTIEDQEVDSDHASDAGFPARLGNYEVEPAKSPAYNIQFYTFDAEAASPVDTNKFGPNLRLNINTTAELTPNLEAVHSEINNLLQPPQPQLEVGQGSLASGNVSNRMYVYKTENVDESSKVYYQLVSMDQPEEHVEAWISQLEIVNGRGEELRSLLVFGFDRELECEAMTTLMTMREF